MGPTERIGRPERARRMDGGLAAGGEPSRPSQVGVRKHLTSATPIYRYTFHIFIAQCNLEHAYKLLISYGLWYCEWYG